MQDAKTLFYGIDRIDGIEFKIKIFVANSTYYLIGKNHEVRLLLEMEEEEYMRLHRNELKGNPCAIFQFLEIVDNQVRFKTKVPEPNSITRKYFPKQLF